MGRETVLFKSEEKKTAAEIAQTLRVVAEKVEAGSITLSTGSDSLELDLPGIMTFEIKAEEEQGRNRVKRSLEFELEWTVGEDDTPQSGAVIS